MGKNKEDCRWYEHEWIITGKCYIFDHSETGALSYLNSVDNPFSVSDIKKSENGQCSEGIEDCENCSRYEPLSNLNSPKRRKSS